MKLAGRLHQAGVAPLLLLGMIGMAASGAWGAGADIESGAWDEDTLDTNAPSHIYYFQADTNDTVIVRAASEDALREETPDVFIYYENRSTAPYTYVPFASMTNKFVVSDMELAITNYGWFKMVCTRPPVLWNYTNPVAYSVSILRMPNAPLSYGDLDVGAIRGGEYLAGTINCGADLDAATFAVSNRCTIQFRMGQGDPGGWPEIPQVRLYDPLGQSVTNDYPPEYRAEITATVSVTGIYTVVMNDYLAQGGGYYVSMIRIPGNLYGNDLEFGAIVNGETKIGSINVPGDLDAAFFVAQSGDVVRVTMSELASTDAALNPVIELFNPSGVRLARGTDLFQQAAIITTNLVDSGTFTIVCKDAEDRFNVSYSVIMTYEPGSPSAVNLPDTPAGLQASDGTPTNRVVVTWSPVTNATGYNVWRSQGTNTALQIFSNYPSATYEDYAVVTNTRYYYKVQARNGSGVNTNFSNSDLGYCGVLLLSSARYALLAGIDNYSPAYPGGQPTSLSTCTNDVIGMKATFMLGDPSNRWSVTNMTIYTDGQADKSSIRMKLVALAQLSAAGDLVTYVHSSHGGLASTNTFISAYNDAYYDYELGADLAQFNTDTKIVVIIDACYSGGMFKDARGQWYWPFAERTLAAYRETKQALLKKQGLAVPKALGTNIAFMTAADSNEVSWTSTFYSLYMGFLIQGCMLTNVDVNRDGEYEFLELHDYAAAEATAVRPDQHAQSANGALLSSTAARAVGTSGGLAQRPDNDYDGDRTSDLTIYEKATGRWYIFSLKRGVALVWGETFGENGFLPVTGDYDGDRIADPAIYNESNGQWQIVSLARRQLIVAGAWGGPGLVPVAGDYNADGIWDAAVVERTNGAWYVTTLTGVSLANGVASGPGFTPVSGDFNADQAAELVMYHNLGHWFAQSISGVPIVWGAPWGAAGCTPIAGDFDGDGISDLAVYYEPTGYWYIRYSMTGTTFTRPFGGVGYQPVRGDFDGDGKTDFAIYCEATGWWFVQYSSGGSTLAGIFGGPGYVPARPTW